MGTWVVILCFVVLKVFGQSQNQNETTNNDVFRKVNYIGNSVDEATMTNNPKVRKLESNFVKIGRVSNGLSMVHIHTTLDLKTFHATHVKVLGEVDKALKAVTDKEVQNLDGLMKNIRTTVEETSRLVYVTEQLMGVYKIGKQTRSDGSHIYTDDMVNNIFEEAISLVNSFKELEGRQVEEEDATEEDETSGRNKRTTETTLQPPRNILIQPDDSEEEVHEPEEDDSTQSNEEDQKQEDEQSDEDSTQLTEEEKQEIIAYLKNVTSHIIEEDENNITLEDPEEETTTSTTTTTTASTISTTTKDEDVSDADLISQYATVEEANRARLINLIRAIQKEKERHQQLNELYNSPELKTKTNEIVALISIIAADQRFVYSESLQLHQFPAAIESLERQSTLIRMIEDIANVTGQEPFVSWATSAKTNLTKVETDKRRVQQWINPRPRQKRQLIAGALALAAVAVFGSGIYSAVEIEYLKNALSNVDSNVHVLGKQVELSHQAINSMEKNLKALETITTKIVREIASVEQTVQARNLLDEVYGLASQHLHYVTEFQATIEDLQRGFFSAKLAMPDELFKLIEETEALVKRKGYTLISPLTSSITSSPASYKTNSNLKVDIFVHIRVMKINPLTLYQFFPHYLEVKDEVLKVVAPNEVEFIAIDIQTDKGMLMTKADLARCDKEKGMFLCPEETVLTNHIRDSCLGALLSSEYTQEDLEQLCLIQLYRNTKREALHQLAPHRVHYHTFVDRMIFVTCGEVTQQKRVTKGSWVIKVDSGCELSTEDYTVVPPETMTVQGPTVILVERLTEVLTETYKGLRPGILPVLKSLGQLQGSHPQELSEIISLRDVNAGSIWVSIGIGLTVAIIGVVIILFCGCMYNCGCLDRCLPRKLNKRKRHYRRASIHEEGTELMTRKSNRSSGRSVHSQRVPPTTQEVHRGQAPPSSQPSAPTLPMPYPN